MNVLTVLQNTDTLAHAYLIRGSSDTSYRLTDILKGRAIETEGNPDFYQRSFEALSIDDARAITSFASLKPIGDYKYILVSAKSVNTQAQHALLKAVEEGMGHSKFFFVIEVGAPVLPTFASRCVVLKETNTSSENEKQAQEFLDMSYQDRLKLAEKFTKNHDREGARALVRSLLTLASHTRNYGSRTSIISETALRDLLEADQYLKLSGSSPKAVIGHLALTL